MGRSRTDQGTEASKTRPAVIVSNDAANRAVEAVEGAASSPPAPL
ncbi:type II toxin-antitoxin system PemK/MazF family toxin [Nonomuraea sp. NPDC059194]